MQMSVCVNSTLSLSRLQRPQLTSREPDYLRHSAGNCDFFAPLVSLHSQSMRPLV